MVEYLSKSHNMDVITGFPEIVKEVYNGFLFTPNDVQSIKSTIEKAIELSDKKYEKLCHNSIVKFDEFYSSDINYKMLLEIYRKAIEMSKDV